MAIKFRFAVGDEVQLVKPFRYTPDDEGDDEDYDAEIRDSGNRGTIVFIDPDSYSIEWVGAGQLYCNEDVVDLIFEPVTDDEVAEALASIGQVSLV